MNNFTSALAVLEENNEFLKDYSKGDDEFYQRYSNGFDAIGDLENYCNKLEEENEELRNSHEESYIRRLNAEIRLKNNKIERLEKALDKAIASLLLDDWIDENDEQMTEAKWKEYLMKDEI